MIPESLFFRTRDAKAQLRWHAKLLVS